MYGSVHRHVYKHVQRRVHEHAYLRVCRCSVAMQHTRLRSFAMILLSVGMAIYRQSKGHGHADVHVPSIQEAWPCRRVYTVNPPSHAAE